MPSDWGKQEFEKFLAWLDPDRDHAAAKHEEIRQRLCKLFVCRACPVAEELADETIDRVIAKIDGLAKTYVGDPRAYFYGVGRNVYLEWTRRPSIPPPQPLPGTDPAGDDIEYESLEECLGRLPQKDRDLIVEYYQDEKQAKIDHRKGLAERLGITLNTLRIRVYRIRARLEECILSTIQLRVTQV